MSENTDKRTATQKIDDLEKVVTVLYQSLNQHKGAIEALQSLGKEVSVLKEVAKLLDRKTDAIVKVAKAETGISVESVKATVEQWNIEDMKGQVAGHLANGYLAPTDTVADDSYVVCEELAPDTGAVVNPRIQFRLDSQADETKNLLRGKKTGDTAKFGETKYDLKVLEVYTLTTPKAPEAAAPQAAEQAPSSDATETTESTTATEAAAPAGYVPPAFAGPDTTPTETPVTFGLEIHGQPDPATQASTA